MKLKDIIVAKGNDMEDIHFPLHKDWNQGMAASCHSLPYPIDASARYIFLIYSYPCLFKNTWHHGDLPS